jgi:teichuronic acid biosynthesis glycosyltransferase TuaG
MSIVNPFVSIIMPAYNAEEFISDSLLSVICQTYANWECIVIDDCSCDQTYEIVSEFVKNDKRIKLLRTENNLNNPSIPRNIGIKYSRGEYLSFIDSDDLWHHEKLEKQLKFMLDNRINFSYTNFDFINPMNITVQNNYRIKSKISYNDLLKCNEIACSTVLYNSTAIGKIEFNTNINRGEDFLLWLQILQKEKFAFLCDFKLTYYRKRVNSISSNKFLTLINIFKIYNSQLYYNFFVASGLTLVFVLKTTFKKYEF